MSGSKHKLERNVDAGDNMTRIRVLSAVRAAFTEVLCRYDHQPLAQ